MNFPKPLPGNVNCVACHMVNAKGCEECRRCADRCGCICRECLNCTPTKLKDGRRVADKSRVVRHHPKYFCHTCKKCKRVNSEGSPFYQCICRKRPSGSKDMVAYKPGDYNTLSRPLGLEVEVSYLGTTRLTVPPFVKYQWVHDGSISAGGQELVLAPLVGDRFLQGVTLLAEDFAKYGFQVDSSCGFHCHVGAEDFGAYELRRLILLYHKFEDVFYKLVAKGRDGWRMHRDEKKYYAKRWPMAESWFTALARLDTGQKIRRYIMEWLYEGRLQSYRDRNGFTTQVTMPKCQTTKDGKLFMEWPAKYSKGPKYGALNVPQIRAHKYENCRYLGLNIHTWFQRGTVEYRHHEGTVALDKMLYWPLWCGWFTEIASVLTDTEVDQISTLDQLLESEWKRPFKVTRIPPPVVEWVRRTLEERVVKTKTA